MRDHIERWQTNPADPYARNARTHSPEQVAQIAASIVEFGFVNPILVDSSAGIIAGHGRLLAARKLGLVEVPVVVLDHLNETQRRAYVLSDNKLALNAGWDNAMLAEELRDLRALDIDLNTLGFSDEEIDAALAMPEEPQDAPDVQEDLPEAPLVAVTRPGDLWLIGEHRLFCGDCRDASSLEYCSRPIRAQPSVSLRRLTPRSASTTPRAASGRSRQTSTRTGSARWPTTSPACWRPTDLTS